MIESAEPLREVAVPLGALCRKALAVRPQDPAPVLAELFAERYGDEGELFHEFCLAQYELGFGLARWHEVVDRNTVAVIAIRDDLPDEAGSQVQATYVVDGGDLSQIPDDLRPLVETALARQVSRVAAFQPVIPPAVIARRQRWARWRLIGLLLCLAGLAWLWRLS